VAIISNAVTIADAGAFSASLGSMVLIKTLTASSSANLTFVHGASSVVLDSTYPIYKFEYTSVHPATDSTNFQVNFRDGGTAYDAPKTSTHFRVVHDEADSSTAVQYDGALHLAQGTGVQPLTENTGNGNDESCSGYFYLFNPSSTTFVKNYLAIANVYQGSSYSIGHHIAGYCNVTAAIDGVQFSFASGNIDAGTIKLYGIKDS